MRTSLLINNGFKWYNNNNVFIKGCIFYHENLYCDENILTLFSNIKTPESFINLIKDFYGQFAVVINLEDVIIAAVDNSRSIPIFYSYVDHNILFLDHISNELLNEPIFDNLSISEFLQTGYVVGNRTLLKNYFQLCAGEYISFNKNKREHLVKKYYIHKSITLTNYKKEQHFKNLEEISHNIFNRLINSLQGRCAVIPLSGGFDSRYIVTMLRKLQYSNVICYTYGRPNSFEVQISKNVAHKLCYKWHYIEYNEASFKELFNDKEFIEYFKYASNYSSLSHYQDLLAVKTLKEKKLIPSDSIFIPGFCGDLLGGSYLPQEVIYNKDITNINISDYIYDRHFNLNKHIKSKKSIDIKNNLNSTLDIYNYKSSYESLVETNDGWFTEHKASKFVVNAVRIFEFYNYEWRLPLWDYDLINYWYNVPYNFKLPNNKLYNEFLFTFLFKDYQVDFIKKFHTDFRDNFVKKLKAIMPISFFLWYRKIISYGSIKQSENSFDILFDYWSKEIGNTEFEHINQIASFWQLFKIYNYKDIDRI